MKRSSRLLIVTLIVFIFILNATAYSIDKKTGFISNAYIQGDVKQIINLKRIEEVFKTEIKYKNNKLEVYSLKDIIKKAGPISEEYSIIFSAQDGLRSQISSDKITESYINFSHEHGWEAINLNHPISSNIKLIESITVVAEGEYNKNLFTIINSDQNLLTKTPGKLLTDTYLSKAFFEGESTQSIEGVNYSTSIYSEKKVLKLEELINKETESRTVIFNEQGKTLKYKGGYLELKKNSLNYINPDKKESLKNIRGIILDAPLKSNKDTFHDALHYLENETKVLIVLLDGFGFHQFEYLKENNKLSFLSNIENVSKVTTSYKPVTNTGLAAVLTGKGPAENGIYNRNYKNLKVPDIFKKADDLGLKSVYVEGNIKILNTFIEPILNPDLNENDTTDDEVFKETKKQLTKDTDLIFAHFHGIDDNGHDFGPFGDKTVEVIKKTDNYLKELAQNWDGKIIITSDHGMHSTIEGGEHGLVLYQDMFVPYLITEGTKGGKMDE